MRRDRFDAARLVGAVRSLAVLAGGLVFLGVSCGSSGSSGGNAVPLAPDAGGDATAAPDGSAGGDAPSDGPSMSDALSVVDARVLDAETAAGPCDPTMTQPVVLASVGDMGLTGVTIDATWVYFGSNGPTGVARVAKTGGAVQQPTVGDASAGNILFPSNSHVALDNDFVYWPADSVGVARTPIATFGQGPPDVFLTHTDAPRGLAVDATRVYLSDIGNSIYAAPKGGGTFTLLATGGFTDDIVTDSSGVYWADGAQGLFKAAEDGGSPILLFGSTYPWSLALDDTSVYATSNDSRIVRVNKDGTDPATVIQLATNVDVFGIAVDDAFIYWGDTLTADGGATPAALRKVPKAGGAPATLAQAATTLNAIAVDGTCVYYTDSGRVMRVAK
jgi:hypothetical protein